MLVYTYNPLTMEFVGISNADEDQLNPGTYLFPAFSTVEECPKFNPETHVAYFDVNANKWIVQDIETEPEVKKITQEQVDSLKKELDEVLEKRSSVLQKLGLSELEVQLLLVKLPTIEQIDELIGQDEPTGGVPSLKIPNF